jgi:hypothetical protein
LADETTTTWANLLREMKGPLVEALRWKTVLLSEVKRNKSPQLWHGKQITIPIITAPQQGTVMIGESSTVGTAQTIDDVQANIKTAIIEHTISFTTQVLRAASSDDTSWAQVMPTKMRMAEDAISRVMNEQMCGTGDGLLAAITGGASGTLVPQVATTANFYQLYPGRIVDIRTRSTGADPGQGLGRKIASVAPSTGVVTMSTTGFGGGSGNITFSTNEGIYIQGTGDLVAWGAVAGVGQALAGLSVAASATGTFQGVSRTTTPAWQGTDGRAGNTAQVDPSISVFDGAERQAMIKAGATPDFYLCDPAVVDKYTQGLTVQARWSGDEAQLSSGFTGVKYRNKVLLPEFDMASQTAIGVSTDDIALYTLDDGPDWEDKTGTMFQRFSRVLPVEAWLVWMVQMGFTRCNTQVKVGNLNQAS